jgi:Rhodopirellula transposase DDE domain
VSIVMGLDQHRGQITGEWIDTVTGEGQRTRVAPADRAAVRKFLQRFRGQELVVALEATKRRLVGGSWSGRLPQGQAPFDLRGCGGSNGYTRRLWKVELGRLAAETGLSITVCHLPPDTSK